MADAQAVANYAEPFVRRGAQVRYLELEATQAARLDRNIGADRLAEKPSKRDLDRSRALLLQDDVDYQLNSTTRVDNTTLSSQEVADRTIKHFQLRSW